MREGNTTFSGDLGVNTHITQHTSARLSVAGQSVATSTPTLIRAISVDTGVLTASIVCTALIYVCTEIITQYICICTSE